MIRRQLLFGVIHRLVYATLLGVAVWYLTIVPFDEVPLPRQAHMAVLKVLDAPLALVAAVLPWRWKPIDVWSSARQPEHANMWQLLRVHMRSAVPIYFVLFYVPAVIRSIAHIRKK